MFAINPGRKIDRAHRRLLEGRSGRFSPEATGTNLIYSFPHPRGESGCSRNCSRPQQKNECGGTSLLVRLSWATFSPAPKIFLWKSRDRAERIYACAPQEEESYGRFSRRSRFRTSALPPGAARSKSSAALSPPGKTSSSRQVTDVVERGEELEQHGADEREAAVSTGCGKRSFRNTVDKNKRNRRKSLIFSARGEATGLTLQKNCPLSRTF
jgi:hypothetical protein